LRKYTNHRLKTPKTLFSKTFEKPIHQIDGVCQLPPKKAKYSKENAKQNV